MSNLKQNAERLCATFQDYEERIASLQEQVERNSMMSSTIRFDIEDDDDERTVLPKINLSV